MIHRTSITCKEDVPFLRMCQKNEKILSLKFQH